jgi:hypothetical protein
MQCLAAGIPCVMHSWVIECCKQNQLVKRDDFILPSGYSIITNSLTTDRYVVLPFTCFRSVTYFPSQQTSLQEKCTVVQEHSFHVDLQESETC